VRSSLNPLRGEGRCGSRRRNAVDERTRRGRIRRVRAERGIERDIALEFAGQRPDWKKAYVTLREGQKMPEFLEGA